MLTQTKLSVALKPAYLERIQSLGTSVELGPNETLFEASASSCDMHVIVRGDIYLYKPGQDLPVVWLGAGDILGEIGFILRTPRTTSARAGSQGCTLWKLDSRIITAAARDEGLMDLLTRLFIGLAPYVRLRLNKLTETTAPARDLLDNHCDHDHPVIRHMAEFLVGGDSWESAANIWEFVRPIPYRFGFWNIKASRVLQQGFGMCVTKTNLQVALMRACEVEAAFGELECAPAVLKPLIPEGYHHVVMQEPKLKHYVALARLGGSWLPFDATYTPQIWQLLDEHAAQVSDDPGRPYNPLNEMIGKDPLDVKRHTDLKHVMERRPLYDADNVEAMNIILDKVQGPFLTIPEWVLPIHYLMQHSRKAAYQRAYSGIVVELERLHAAISTSTGTADPASSQREALV